MERHELIIVDTQGQFLVQELPFQTKKTINLGRQALGNDLIINEIIVSKNHGTFLYDNNILYYKDNNSTNGTFIENYNQRRLLTADHGYVQIPDKTIIKIGNLKQPDKMVVMIYRKNLKNERWTRFDITKPEISIGRDAACDLQLSHPGILRKHMQLVHKSAGMCLKMTQLGIGVTVNGRDVGYGCMLKDKDIIQVMGYQMIFCGNCIYYTAENTGIYLKICDVNKVVGSGKNRKQILHHVNCEIDGSEFVAIIGGSGAGKSTLMNAISCFDADFTGTVYCNGLDLKEQFQNIKDIIGYVPQQDIIYENLTLKKMLEYTAKLKMPEDTTKDEISKRIREVLDIVELSEHQNTFIRKLSGGQKKRASIAVELLADPKLFFLDEPTSGLDPGTEKNLMQTLSKLAKTQGKTIIMVTHTTQNLNLCDKIIFMGPGGRLCFCGNVDAAKTFFHTDELVNIYNMLATDVETWEKRYYETASPVDPQDAADTEPMAKKRKTSGVRQWAILSKRYTALIMNDRMRLFILLLQPLLIGLLLFVVADDEVFEIYESTKSILFALSCSGIWIGLFDSIQEVCKERVILKREYMANLKLSSYIFSKFVVLTVLGGVQAFILATVFLLLKGKSCEGLLGSNFYPEIVITVWLTVLASIALGMAISCIVKSTDKAMTIAPFALIIQLLFSGILFKLSGASEIISYVTVSRWSVEALGSSANLNGLDLRLQQDFPMLEHEAETFFEAAKAHLFKDWFIMLIMIAICIVLSMVLLRNVKKDTR